MDGLKWINVGEERPEPHTHVLTVDMTEEAPMIWHNLYSSDHFVIQWGKRKPTHWAAMNFPDRQEESLEQNLKEALDLLSLPVSPSCQAGVLARCRCAKCVLERGRSCLERGCFGSKKYDRD